MNHLYDVIVIGAGPSGTSCAYNLKRLNPNASVLIIDKASFPRYKTCGGGISSDVLHYLDFDLSDAIDYRCNETVLVANDKKMHSKTDDILMVRRDVFDDFLLNKAKQQGVDVRLECEVIDVVQAQKSTVKTKKGDYHARFVVLAEGGSGRVAKKLNIAPKNEVWAGLEYEHYTDTLDGKLYIHFDRTENGYAWNFPKSDGLSLGIGGLVKGTKNGRLPQKLKHFLTQYRIHAPDKEHLHGHPIQVYRNKQKLVHDSLLLVGEIAGCVDPLTAEGIRPSIKSGYLAASVLSEALIANQSSKLKKYDVLFHKEIGKDYRFARIVLYFMHRYPQSTLRVLQSSSAVNCFMQVFSGQSTYRAQLSLKRLGRLVKNALLSKVSS